MTIAVIKFDWLGVSGRSFLTGRITSQHTGNTPQSSVGQAWPIPHNKQPVWAIQLEVLDRRMCHIFSSCTFVSVEKLKGVKYLLYLILQDSLGVLCNKDNKDSKIL